MKPADYTFTLKVHNTPSVLARVAQVFARRGCRIQSLNMQQEPEDGQWAIMKVQAHDISRPDQIQLQLEKLVDIHSVVAQKLRADQAS